jgi:hypothetical protein
MEDGCVKDLYRIMLRYRCNVKQNGDSLSALFYWGAHSFVNKYMVDRKIGRILQLKPEDVMLSGR